MNHRSKTRLSMCTASGLLMAAAGAVGLSMMALMAPRAHVGQGVLAQSAIAAATAQGTTDEAKVGQLKDVVTPDLSNVSPDGRDVWIPERFDDGVAGGCALVCPPGARIEAEICGADLNGGCNSTPTAYEVISCGQTVCGSAWADLATRDTDWYELFVPDPDGNGFSQINLTITSQLPVVMFVLDIATPGPPGPCGAITLVNAGAFPFSDLCVPGSGISLCLPAPATYFLFAGTGTAAGAGVFDGFPCGGVGGNDYVFTVTCKDCAPPDPPNNDLCADRRPIFNGKTAFDNTASALDGPTCDINMTTDVWWNYIAVEDGFVEIDTCQDFAGTLTDTVLTVYNGCDCAALGCLLDVPPGNELASDDDSCGIDGFSSQVKIPVVAGNCYKIQVGGFDGTQGTGIVTISKQGPCEQLPGAPANDCCDRRVLISNGQTPFSNVGASSDGPSPCGGLGSDIWYNYIAVQDGFVDIDTLRPPLAPAVPFDTVLAVYKGCDPLACPPAGAPIACNDDSGGTLQSAVKIPVIGGNCYKIQVGGFNGAQGDGFLTITKQPQGACCIWDGTCVDGTTVDTCAALGGAFQGDGSTCLDPLVDCTPPVGANFFNDPGAFQTALLATDKRAKASWDFKPNKAAPGIIVALDDPLNINTHFLDPDSPWFNPLPPNNDLCLDRRPIFNGKTPFDNTASALDGPTCDANMTTDVWWNYTADFTGDLQVDTCQDGPPGTLTDTVLTVYNGCGCGAALGCLTDVPPGNELASDDDSCGVVGFSSTVTVPVVQGNCYKIQVGGWNGTTGTGIVTLSKPPPPPVLNNNLCIERRPIDQDALTPFDTTAATTDGVADPLCLFFGVPQIFNDIWYNFTPAVTDTFDISLCGSSYDTKLAVYLGCVCPTGAPIACNDDFCGLQSQVKVDLVAGQCYKIRVGGFTDGGGGAGQILISKQVPPPGAAGGGAGLDKARTGRAAMGAFAQRVASDQGGGIAGGVNLWPPSVDNVTFQSNVGPNPQPPLPNPRGIDGLAFGNAVANYDNNILIANTFLDSFDILSGPPAGDNHTAMSIEIVTAPQVGGVLGPVLVTVWGKPDPLGEEALLGKIKVGIFQNPPPPPPPNNDCIDVVPVQLVRDVPQVFNGDNTNSTNDCPSFPGGHVWEAIIMPAGSTILNLGYCGSANSNNGGPFGNAWLNLAEGCPCVSFTAAGTFAFSCADGNVEIQWIGLTAGATYYYPVLLDPVNNAIGLYTLTFTAKNAAPCDPGAPGTPVNNCCSARVPIFNGKTAFDNTGATLDGLVCETSMTGDVWWNYTADFTGNLTVDTCQDGPPATLTDTILTVYNGCDCLTLGCLPGGNELASNDDTVGCGVSAFGSSVTVPVVLGNCYKIQVGGFSGQTGTGIITITKPPAGVAGGRGVAMGDIARSKPAARKATKGKAGLDEPTSILGVAATGGALTDGVGARAGGIAGGPVKKTFLGILMKGDLTIGRVNLLDLGGGAEGISKITVYTDSPGILQTDIAGPLGAGIPDGCVDAFDLGLLLGAWCSSAGDPDPPGDVDPPCEGCLSPNFGLADISGPDGAPDGCVDAFDLAKLLNDWCSVAGGNPCGSCF
ncbi:MAG: hypothetical protein IH983_04595 [Planctomycetes bacterium]|nr:hypothetical protein [Planctomycetota bacterium]